MAWKGVLKKNQTFWQKISHNCTWQTLPRDTRDSCRTQLQRLLVIASTRFLELHERKAVKKYVIRTLEKSLLLKMFLWPYNNPSAWTHESFIIGDRRNFPSSSYLDTQLGQGVPTAWRTDLSYNGKQTSRETTWETATACTLSESLSFLINVNGSLFRLGEKSTTSTSLAPCEFLTTHPQETEQEYYLWFPPSSPELSNTVCTQHSWQKSLAFHSICMRRQPLLPAAVLTSVQMHSIKSTREQRLITVTVKWFWGEHANGGMASFCRGLPQRLADSWWVHSHGDTDSGMSQRRTETRKKTHLQAQPPCPIPAQQLVSAPSKLHPVSPGHGAKGSDRMQNAPLSRYLFS